ncbi:MAG: metallophosphoesterase family protein [Verrucomicrobia bacterium]|nr:metallophosphoesterase family protein [Verrucomicrobiota bacterium]
MNRIHRFSVLLALTTAAALAEPFDPSGILLTWQRDPTTTMTIDWHSIEGVGIELVNDLSVGHNLPVKIPVYTKVRPSTLEFRARGETGWKKAEGRSFPFPFKEDRKGSLHRDGYSHSFPPSGRTVHRVELTALASDAVYEFRFDDGGKIHHFRTLPKTLSREVRFAAGGDIGFGTWTERMNRIAASHDPDFVIWGGDLAYCDGAKERLGRWYDFFDSLKKSLVTAEGRTIPVLATVGNHEVQGGFHKPGAQPDEAEDARRLRLSPYFMSFFAMPGQPGYNVLDFGDYLSVILLDSGHLNPVGGAQAAWLDETLSRRAKVPHVFPAYHVPGFGTFRPLSDRYATVIREQWVPLFEKYRLAVVFENHEHNYKRTVPIRNMKPDATGVTYLGDGAWGAWNIGITDRENKWYLEKADSLNHFILVKLKGPEARFEAFNLLGDVFDRHRARRP